MRIVARTHAPATIPLTWHASLPAADQRAVSYLPAAIHLGECTFCPPTDPAHPAVAALLYIDHRTGIRTLPVGQHCGVTALQHLLGGDTGHVTVVHPPAVPA